MNSSVPDYKRIYTLQDRIISVIGSHLGEFYLTGGTALGRFYLNHRYSDDLDFFVNQSPDFSDLSQKIFKLLQQHFRLDESLSVDAPEYKRIWISDEITMKVEFVNDVSERWGIPLKTDIVPVDNPGNILANKLTAMLSRDEAKDIFDIVTLADSYSFIWKEVYREAAKKQLINEPDIIIRLTTFPVEWLENQRWLKMKVDLVQFKEKLERIADDFLFAKENSLGVGKTPIEKAMPKTKLKNLNQ